MSYAIVSNIQVINNRVYITSCDNNVRPRDHRQWECTELTNVLQKQGQEALELEFMKDYENGNMQPGTHNKYTKAVSILQKMPEYAKFNWRGEDYNIILKAREEEKKELETLLLKALNTR